ncbi:MAG: HEPN domain-containing protein [Saprospiraceae bacterium]|nr:MAG: HEPN domain-containing protein [Saprospiraceae bacterium]
MSLTNDERNALVSFRIQKAKDTLKEAEGIATLGYWNAVANRLYYACYYITSALLVKNNYAAQTHKGVIHLLGMHFIKTGIVPNSAGKLYTKLFELRQTGDYDDMSNLAEDIVKPMIVEAQNYLDVISALIVD